MSRNSDHDKDFYAWTQQTVKDLKNRNFDHLDIEHLIEEIESMGHSELRALSSHLTRLVAHLLKLQYQASYINTQSWVRSVQESRKQVSKLVSKQPSLKSKIEREYEDCYDSARYWALNETGLQDHAIPLINPFTLPEALDLNFIPGQEEPE